LNLETTTVLCSGWKKDKAHQCQGSGTEGSSATTWGANLVQGKGHRDIKSDTRVFNSHVFNGGPVQA